MTFHPSPLRRGLCRVAVRIDSERLGFAVESPAGEQGDAFMQRLRNSLGRGASRRLTLRAATMFGWMAAIVPMAALDHAAGAGNMKPAAATPATPQDRAPLVVRLQAEPFRLEDVRLLDGPFKHAMELDRKYLLSLDVDRLLHVFRLNAGLPSTAKPYGGWMAPERQFPRPFRRPLSVGLRPDVRQHRRRAAQGEGRPGGGRPGRVPGEDRHRLPPRLPRDVHRPLRSAGRRSGTRSHKIFAGLLDMYVYCGNQQALDVARKLGDWAWRGRRQVHRRADAGDARQRARRHERGAGQPLRAAPATKIPQARQRFNHMAVLGPAMKREDDLDGLHANTQIPKFIGTPASTS